MLNKCMCMGKERNQIILPLQEIHLGFSFPSFCLLSICSTIIKQRSANPWTGWVSTMTPKTQAPPSRGSLPSRGGRRQTFLSTCAGRLLEEETVNPRAQITQQAPLYKEQSSWVLDFNEVTLSWSAAVPSEPHHCRGTGAGFPSHSHWVPGTTSTTVLTGLGQLFFLRESTSGKAS